MKKILAGILLAIAMAATAPATPAGAITTTPVTCYYRVDNSLLHPTWRVHCYNTSRYYRAKAWCQVAWAYGPWMTGGDVSKAQCFFVNVDTKASTMQWK